MIHAVGNPPGPEGPTVSCLIVPSLLISSSEDIWTHFPRAPSHSPAVTYTQLRPVAEVGAGDRHWPLAATQGLSPTAVPS